MKRHLAIALICSLAFVALALIQQPAAAASKCVPSGQCIKESNRQTSKTLIVNFRNGCNYAIKSCACFQRKGQSRYRNCYCNSNHAPGETWTVKATWRNNTGKFTWNAFNRACPRSVTRSFNLDR